MKSLKENVILLSLLVFIFTLLYKKFFFVTLLAVLLLWYLRTKDQSWILLCCLLVLISIPRNSNAYPKMEEAKAIHVKGSYSILKSKNEKVIVYTDTPLALDGVYSIHGTFQEIESSSHFYAFDYASWCHKQGVYFSIDEENISLLHKTFSVRSFIQNKINQLDDENKKQFLYKTLLNITLKDTDETNWFYEYGFSYAGTLSIINAFLKYFLDKNKRDKILLILSGFMIIIQRFPMLLVQIFLYQLLKYTKISYKKKTGIITTSLTILYPESITSITFLLPVLYHYSFLFEDKKNGVMFFSFLIQTITFQSLNPLKSILFPIFTKVFGLLHIVSILDLFLQSSFTTPISKLLQFVLSFIDTFTINGSIFGIGLIIYLIVLIIYSKQKHFFQKAYITLIFFLLFGLFHPCKELTIINVGQGDSILVRDAFNTCNILVDTGKESAYSSLQTFLNAKGIKKINTLIISHPDDDHDGNKQIISNEYDVSEVISEHFTSKQIGNFLINDINEISNDDTNESSIVNTFEWNDKQVCFMGDSDQYAEENIIKNHPELTCDILKVSHHGSKSGSSNAFLDTVKPKIAFISSGKYSIYHHPSEEVIQKLLKRHIPYLDTKTSGDITILSIFKWDILITSNFEIALL